MQSFPSLKKKVEEETLKPKGGHNSASSLDLRKIATTVQNVDGARMRKQEAMVRESGACLVGGDKLRRRYSADNMRAQNSDSDVHDEPEQEHEQEHEELFTMDEDDPANGSVRPFPPAVLFIPLFPLILHCCEIVICLQSRL
jgi:hypothetical protein